MAFHHITSRDNAKFKHLKKLAQNNKYRKQSQETLIEGVHLIQAYQQVFGEPKMLIVPEGQSTTEANDLIQQLGDVETMLLPTLLFAELTPVTTSAGVMAVIEIPVLPKPKDNDFALLLVEIQDPGNLGSMLRTAVAAGVQSVYLTKDCTDAWSPKALRGGQGAQFLLPIEIVESSECLATFTGNSYAMTMHGESLYAQDFAQPSLMVMGNEGAGLPQAVIDQTTKAITIPMAQSNAAIESLNVAAAAAICLFECKRQRTIHAN